MQRTQSCSIRWLTLGLTALTLCGCSRVDRSQTDILPNTDKARVALDKALTAWKNGEKMGSIKEEAYTVEVADRIWMAGKKLSAFEILEAEDKPGPRWFSVRLTLKGSQPQTVRYAVLGINPLWVYREEDFNKLCEMGNK